MDKCIYCGKVLIERTKEHIIPQFLGGNYAPDIFLTRDVCPCNNTLGQKVDAGFSRCWPISVSLAQHLSLDWQSQKEFPLWPLGISEDIKIPEMPENYTCELRLGPSGEQVFWLRPHSAAFESFIGGDPILTKRSETELYFLLNEKSSHKPLRTRRFLERSMSKHDKKTLGVRNLKKFVCGEVRGLELEKLGFTRATGLQKVRADYLMKHTLDVPTRHISTSISLMNFHLFFSKLVIGLNYALFTAESLEGDYVKDLQRFLNDGVEVNDSNLLLTTSWGNDEIDFTKIPYFDHGVTLSILIHEDVVFAVLCLDRNNVFTFKVNDISCISESKLSELGTGKVLILFKVLKASVFCSLSEYVDHICRLRPIPKLDEIKLRLEQLHEQMDFS